MPGLEAVSPGLACCAALLWVTNGIVDERDFNPNASETGELNAGESLGSQTSSTGSWNVWRRGAGVPLLFAVWSCVDASFVVGWSLLGVAAAGRGLDLIRDGRTVSNIARDRVLRQWLSLIGLAVAATLLGPNGLEWWDRARVEVNLIREWIDQLLRLEAVASVAAFSDGWNIEWWRSAFLASVAGGGIWWLTLSILRQSRRRWASAELLLLLLSTITYWLWPHRSGWFALAWGVALVPHLSDLSSQQWADTDRRSQTDYRNLVRDPQSAVLLGERSGWSDWRWFFRATWLISTARLSRLVRRLVRDEEPLLLEAGHLQAASTVLMPIFSLLFVVTGTWFVRHAGAGPVSEGECLPRVRPVAVCPLRDDRSVVSDSQLSHVCSRSLFATEYQTGDLLRSTTFRAQTASLGIIREAGLARSLATAGWLGLSTDTVIRTESGERPIGTLLQQLWREFRLGATPVRQGSVRKGSARQGPVAVAGSRPDLDREGSRAEGPHPLAASLLAFAFYLPESRVWNDAEGGRVSFDRLAELVVSRERPRHVGRAETEEDVRAELERLWSLAVLLRIDDQQSLLTAKSRSRVVTGLQLATSQLCAAQHRDGSWDEAWWLEPTLKSTEHRAARELQGESRAMERFVARSASAARLFTTARILEWWALAPREALPPQDVPARATRWLCDEFEALVPSQSLSEAIDSHSRHAVDGGDPPVMLAQWVSPEFSVQPEDQSRLAEGHVVRALALWRGRTPEAALREELLRGKTAAAYEPRSSHVNRWP